MHQDIASATRGLESQEMTPKAKHSGDRTDAGKGWVKSLSRPRKDPPQIESRTAAADDQPAKGARFFHGRTGTYPARPGDILTPQRGGMSHMYYTTHLPTARRAAAYGHPLNEHGYQDLDKEAVPGHVYEVVPETAAGKRIGRHAVDPASGLPGAEQSWRTKGRLRVLHEVDRDSGEPLSTEQHTAALEGVHCEHTAALGLGELDQHLEHWFHPQQLDAERVTHPRSGYQVEKGEQRRVHHPDEGEGPAHFEIWDHGEPGVTNSLAYPKRVRSEPIQHVYRGVSAEEWKQARQRGHVQSDQRGTIGDWEGTNAAVDPRSAVSYLPRNAPGHVLKIRVHPGDGWFTHNVDSYLRTRKPVPLDRVEGVSPSIFKGGKYGNEIEVGQHEGPMEHTAAAPYDIHYDLDHHGRHRVSAWPAGHQGDRSPGGGGTPLGALHWHPDDGEITYMRVEDGHRRQGIGTALWQRAHQESAERGLVPPAHSAGTGFAEGVGGHLPPLDREHRERDWSGEGEEYQYRPRTAALEGVHCEHTAAVAPAPAAPARPLAQAEETVTAIGAWSPQEPSDAREVLEDLPEFFRAAARGLDSLTARLTDSTPVSEEIIDVVASMGGACHTAAGDADEILAHFRQVSATEGV